MNSWVKAMAWKISIILGIKCGQSCEKNPLKAYCSIYGFCINIFDNSLFKFFSYAMLLIELFLLIMTDPVLLFKKDLKLAKNRKYLIF